MNYKYLYKKISITLYMHVKKNKDAEYSSYQKS